MKTTVRTGKKETAPAKTASPTGYWRSHAKRYADSWRSPWRWRTLLHVGLDLLLIAILLTLLMVNSAAWDAVATPLVPTLQAVAQLESAGNATTADRVALLNAYKPDVNGAILKGVLATLALGLAFAAAYAIVKTRIWASLQQRPFVWRRYGKNLLATVIAALLLFGVPFGILYLSPAAAAYTFFALLVLALLVLPLLYAAERWRPLLSWRLIGGYLVVAAAEVVTWLVAVNLIALTVWINEWLYTALFAAWTLLFLAWGRGYVGTLVKEQVKGGAR